MAHHGRQGQLPRPDSRAGQAAGRFASALSAALRLDDYARPPLPPAAPKSKSAEEELEEVEQKITLTLQAIDANFDHSQRTMARDVMPKVEQLGRLSGELLQASQPWLQFFMAVAAADENDEAQGEREGQAQGSAGSIHGDDQLDDDYTQATALGLAQRAAIEEQAHKSDITARFPEPAREDDEESIDIDAEVATPQLTSRFMTEELRAARMQDTATSTPRVQNLKRMAEYLSVSAKKRKLGTPRAGTTPKTPVSMMRALVSARPSSVVSHVSMTSSIGTEDLMPNTSPPHTATFVLPQSRRIAPPRVAAAAVADDRLGFGEDDDDDEILDEINNLIRRYDSPRDQAAAPASASPTRSSARRSAAQSAAWSDGGSVARSEAHSVATNRTDERHMAALADKYAAPVLDIAPGTSEARRAQGLVADMEEMLEEVEAMAADNQPDSPGDAAEPPEAPAEDIDDELPSPPKITSDLERSHVVVPEIGSSTTGASLGACGDGSGGRDGGGDVRARQRVAGGMRGAIQPRRTFGRPNPVLMSAEDMDAENMTIGHMSPLALRGRPVRNPFAEPAAPPAAVGQRFIPLGSDPDDPFGPTPARHEAADMGPRSRGRTAPLSVQSDRPATTGTADAQAGAGSALPWSSRLARGAGDGGSAANSSLALGSDATATFDSPGLAAEHPTGDSRLNDSIMTIDHNDFSQPSIDGTTTILPTRDMLQRAARAAEGSAAAASPGAARSPTPPSPAGSLVHEFAADMFPPMFQSPPASLQLRELWELLRAEDQRIWSLDELVAASAAGGELAGASPSVFMALLDLLARRRLVRRVADGLKMSVFSSNPFALLDDNAVTNDVDALAKKGKKQQQQQPAKPKAAPLPERARPSERTIKPSYPSRGGFRGGASREPRAAEAAADGETSRAGPVHQSQRGRGAPRGRGRQFDRHSATGLNDSAKKEKQGWLGAPEDMPADGVQAADEVKQEGQEGAATPVAEEPEEVVKSLDDYLNERSANQVDTKRTVRKANEAGVDKSQLKATVVLQRTEEDLFAATATRKARKQKDRKEKQLVDIEQRFNDQSRGAFRGPRGGANSRPDRRPARQTQVSINDKGAFPTLG
ncbi:hypothetical protein LPJ61_001140 [Coemansia biformis]|uniref:Hyaluronan/mRNA-binding protein domain-containing protein n=1 Tax=Coemansia biformis TaxID=1286918 RepID=A0A9W8D0D3_9FUNG|nr:hypothetical protein LPJ61_001140 [Coemansia biformis]